jgi:hypothetical protein
VDQIGVRIALLILDLNYSSGRTFRHKFRY